MTLRALLIALGCLAAATAWADEQASRWSFGTQLGFAQGKGDPGERPADLSTLSYDASATFGEKSRLGWRVFTGYRFTDYLAVHVGYTDLGELQSRVADEFQGGEGMESPERVATQTIRGIDVGMQVKVPLGERFAMELRGGKYYWQSRTRTTAPWSDDYRLSRRDSDLFFGAGMEVALRNDLSATLGWTRYEVAGEPIALWTVGALYRFSMY